MPYWRLSAYYFFYFASLGALVPFWGPYLQERGLTPLEIGQVMAIFLATKLLAPNLWGWLADRTGRRMGLVRLASLVAALMFAGVFWAEGFWGLALVMALFSFFWNASLPQMEAITCTHLGDQVRRYASIRLWGSVGFILAVLGLGLILERGLPTTSVPVVVLALYGGIWLASLTVPEAPCAPSAAPAPPILGLLRRPEVLAFLCACLLMQVSHGPYYAFFSIHLEQLGYGRALIGALWALGVGVEVLAFLVMHRLLDRFGARWLLLASLGLACLRWVLTGLWADTLGVLLLAQTLHAATFGVFHASAIHLAHHYFPGRLQGRGQALYNSISFGAGGALGSLFSGYLWATGGALPSFLACATVAALGMGVAWAWVDRERRF